MDGYAFAAIVVVALVVIVALRYDNGEAVKDLLVVLGHLFGRK